MRRRPKLAWREYLLAVLSGNRGMDVNIPVLHVGALDGGLYINFDGRATHRVCAAANRLIGDYLSSKPEHGRIVLDLGGCAWIDSTFAGWLIGLRKRADAAGAELLLSGCSERCTKSFGKMNIAGLFRFGDVDPPVESGSIPCEGAEKPDVETLKLMIEAHRGLAAVNAENERVFAPIADMLTRELQQAR